jgi:hypothetical protein
MRSGQVVDVPRLAAKAEVMREDQILDSPEAMALKEAMVDAIFAYVDHLDCQGLFYQDDPDDPDDVPIVKADTLVITAHPIDGVVITVKGGAADRLFNHAPDPGPYKRNP